MVAGEEKRGAPRAPIVLRIRLRYPDVDTFIDKFSTNLSATGMFISTRTPRPEGTEVKFELRLVDDSPVVRGAGVVKWTRAFDPDRPRRAHGMGLEFTELDEQSRAVIEQVVAYKRSLGGDDDSVPAPRKKRRSKAKEPALAVAEEVDTLADMPGLAEIVARARAEHIDDPELSALLEPAPMPRAPSVEQALAELRSLD